MTKGGRSLFFLKKNLVGSSANGGPRAGRSATLRDIHKTIGKKNKNEILRLGAKSQTAQTRTTRFPSRLQRHFIDGQSHLITLGEGGGSLAIALLGCRGRRPTTTAWPPCPFFCGRGPEALVAPHLFFQKEKQQRQGTRPTARQGPFFLGVACTTTKRVNGGEVPTKTGFFFPIQRPGPFVSKVSRAPLRGVALGSGLMFFLWATWPKKGTKSKNPNSRSHHRKGIAFSYVALSFVPISFDTHTKEASGREGH